MFNKPFVRYMLSALVIVVGGFILFNVAFLLAALIFNGTNTILSLEESQPPSPWGIGIYAGILAVATYYVFKSKLKDLYKATFMTMPLMVAMIGQGILLYEQPQIIPISIGTTGILLLGLFFYKNKKTWEYYFASLFVCLVLIITILFNIEI